MKSIAQATSGAAGAKSRASAFPATGGPCRESVVRTNRLADSARIPLDRMSFATAFTRQATPRAFNSACTRGLLYRAWTSACISPIRATNSARRVAAAPTGRPGRTPQMS